LLAWSSVHGMAHLYIDGPVGNADTQSEKLATAEIVLEKLKSAF